MGIVIDGQRYTYLPGKLQRRIGPSHGKMSSLTRTWRRKTDDLRANAAIARADEIPAALGTQSTRSHLRLVHPTNTVHSIAKGSFDACLDLLSRNFRSPQWLRERPYGGRPPSPKNYHMIFN